MRKDLSSWREGRVIAQSMSAVAFCCNTHSLLFKPFLPFFLSFLSFLIWLSLFFRLFSFLSPFNAMDPFYWWWIVLPSEIIRNVMVVMMTMKMKMRMVMEGRV